MPFRSAHSRHSRSTARVESQRTPSKSKRMAAQEKVGISYFCITAVAASAVFAVTAQPRSGGRMQPTAPAVGKMHKQSISPQRGVRNNLFSRTACPTLAGLDAGLLSPPLGTSSYLDTHGLRRGLHSSTASRLAGLPGIESLRRKHRLPLQRHHRLLRPLPHRQMPLPKMRLGPLAPGSHEPVI
jgi:hypothetical protein